MLTSQNVYFFMYFLIFLIFLYQILCTLSCNILDFYNSACAFGVGTVVLIKILLVAVQYNMDKSRIDKVIHVCKNIKLALL